MGKLDIVDRLKSASECKGAPPFEEAQSRLIEAAETIESLRSLLEPLQN